MLRKGCLLAAAVVALAAGRGVAGCGCGGPPPGPQFGPPVGQIRIGCPFPTWWYNAGGPCYHIGTYGCAPPSNYHTIVWGQPPEASAAMVRQQLARLNIIPPPVPAREPAPAPLPPETKPKPKTEELPPPSKDNDPK